MTRVYFLLFGLITTISSFCQPSDTIEYSIVNSGNLKGFDKYWKNSDGSIGEWYQFNDRGRGDSLRIVFREDEQGFPTYLSANGKDYMKNNVFEEYNLSNGTATWKNNAEDEQRQVNEKLFYIGLKTSGGHLIKALLANGNKLKLLPYGEVRLTELEKHVVSSGALKKTVRLVQIDGFGLTPTYNWIDENNTDFGSVSEWNSSILKGFEKNVDELLSIQKNYETSYFNKLASTIPQQPTKDILITGVSIFDAVNARIVANKDVLIHDGVIQKISDSKKEIGKSGNRSGPETGKYLVIDGKGKTILPGLWDMHVHFADNTDGILHMAAGVTHVRDMGNSEILLDRIKQISEGKIIGPRVEIMSGFIDGAGPFAAPTGVLINNVDEGIKAIRNYAAKGYQQIKLYSSIKPEWVKPLIDEAKQHHLRVAGHIPAFMTATQAINAGYNEVTHMNMLVLNFFGDTVDTRSPLRFSLPAQKAISLDLHGPAMNQFIQLLKQKDITVDPTLTAFEDMFTSRDKVISEKFKSTVDREYCDPYSQ